MELDLIDVQFDLHEVKPRELEEALEDPFTVRFLPRHLFCAIWADGKTTRVVAARDMTESERKFYDRKYADCR
ncbi:MAG: BrnT family toxin [Verrucomicrobia bacterium]|nr:BrnT family toxin [Verrucomicrobiota bacterium]